MWKSLFASTIWPLATVASVLARPQAAIHQRNHDDHHGHESSQSIVTVTVDWLPTHGPVPSETTISEGKQSSTVVGEIETNVAIVTVTTTVQGPGEIASYNDDYDTDMYPPPAEPTILSSSTPPIGFTTTITHHGPCQPVSSSTQEVKVVLVTVTTTEYVPTEIFRTVTEVYSTVVRTLSTRGPHAPPLTTW